MPHLPPQFLKSISESPGLNLPAFIKVHEQEEKVTSIRFNPFKPFSSTFLCAQAVPWAQQAFYLHERPSFTMDPAFHAGCYYVQEAGSMFLDQAIRSVFDLSKSFKVLDVCAAPGGKSTLINSLLPAEGLLVSNEIIKNRSLVLADQLGKWGQANTIVLNMEPAKLRPFIKDFDLLVVDAPCSGSGLFRKQPEALSEWSPESVTACSIRQKNILADLVPEMRDGAYLFYSTCSYSVQENEEIVNWLQEERGLSLISIPLEKEWGIVDSGSGYRFYPDQLSSEGFFCALLQKPGTAYEETGRRREGVGNVLKDEEKTILEQANVSAESLQKKNGFIYTMPLQVRRFLNEHEGKIYVRKAGICLGEIKGRDLVPAQDLALSSGIAWRGATLELDKQEALQFLRKEVMPARLPQKGFVKVTYERQGLGWIKMLSNRINNYLPNEARILKQS